MQTVKCAFCHKSIPKDKAMAVRGASRNKYYCPEHVGAKSPHQAMTDRVSEIMGSKIEWSVFNRDTSSIVKEHGLDKINNYLESNMQYLSSTMDKIDSSPFARTRYFIAILKNNLPQYEYRKPEVIPKKIEETQPAEERFKQKKKRPSLNDLIGQSD